MLFILYFKFKPVVYHKMTKRLFETRQEFLRECAGSGIINGAEVCLKTIYPLKRQWKFLHTITTITHYFQYVSNRFEPEPKYDANRNVRKNDYQGNMIIQYLHFGNLMFQRIIIYLITICLKLIVAK